MLMNQSARLIYLFEMVTATMILLGVVYLSLALIMIMVRPTYDSQLYRLAKKAFDRMIAFITRVKERLLMTSTA